MAELWITNTVNDLRHGSHRHHEHGGSRLDHLGRLLLDPFEILHMLASDLEAADLAFRPSALFFAYAIDNRGALDRSDVGVAVLADDRYSSHGHLRLPGLVAGRRDRFTLPLPLSPGAHPIEVIADPRKQILESEDLQTSNRQLLEVVV
jgi:hypothetical protein